jgi:hypothetical protein
MEIGTMRTAQPNFMLVLSGITDRLFSVLTSKARSNHVLRFERVIRWFEKDGDALVGELRLSEFDLSKLQRLFNISKDNPMYDCYPIKTKRQIQHFKKITNHPIDTRAYDYFLECDAIELPKRPARFFRFVDNQKIFSKVAKIYSFRTKRF